MACSVRGTYYGLAAVALGTSSEGGRQRSPSRMKTGQEIALKRSASASRRLASAVGICLPVLPAHDIDKFIQLIASIVGLAQPDQTVRSPVVKVHHSVASITPCGNCAGDITRRGSRGQ